MPFEHVVLGRVYSVPGFDCLRPPQCRHDLCTNLGELLLRLLGLRAQCLERTNHSGQIAAKPVKLVGEP